MKKRNEFSHVLYMVLFIGQFACSCFFLLLTFPFSPPYTSLF